MEMVKSLGAVPSDGTKAAPCEATRPYRAVTFAAGWCAILMAAVAVSLGITPVAVPSEVAFSNSVVQFSDGEGVEEVVFTQAARMSAMVLIWAWGSTLGV